MKKVFVTLLTLIICQAGIAQNQKINERIEKKVAELNELLNLSSEQEQNIQLVLLETAKQMKELKSAEEVDPEQIRAVRKQSMEKIRAELSEDQLLILEENKKAKRAEQKARESKAKEHRKNELKPALKTERQQFENSLNQEERDLLQNARALAKNYRARNHEELSKEERQAHKEEIKEMLKPVLDTHSKELSEIEGRLRPAMDSQRALRQEARVRKTKSDVAPPMKEDRGQFEIRFLLMEP